MNIGQQIKRFRKSHPDKITQDALAVHAGVTKDQISQIERGISNPGQDTLEKICKALGCEQKIVFK